MAASARPRGSGRHRFYRNNSGNPQYRNNFNNNNNNNNRLFRSREHGSRILGSMYKLRESNKFCDVELLLEGKVFNAHKVILASSSPYFQAMFGSGLAEEQQKTIEIHEISPAIFELLLEFIYKGEIRITQENVQDLLAAANMLELSEVETACCDFLRRELHPSNCIGIFRFAELHSCTNLKLEAKRFVERNFTDVIQEEEFYDLPKDTLKNFLKSEGLCIDSEFQVFDATMKWILRDARNRRKFIFEVLQSIRFPVISQKQLDNYVEQCSDLSLKVALQSLLQDLRQEFKARSVGQDFDIRLQPRMCTRKCVYVIGGYHRSRGQRFGEGCTLQSVEKLDISRLHWSHLASMNFPRSGHGVAVLNSLVYVVGGEHDGMLHESGEVYEPLTNQWSMIDSLNFPRTMFGLCALDGALYALGGCIGTEIGDTVEKYDPLKDTWHLSSRMTIGRCAMGVIAYQGLIYVIGGFGIAELELVESFNPVTNEWTCLAPMRLKRKHIGVAVLCDHIYVVGGTSNCNTVLRSVERYSIEENKWTEIPPLRKPRAGASVIAVSGRLYVVGGQTGGDEFNAPITLDTVEVYDPETNTWKECESMSTSRCDAGIVMI